MPCCWGIHYYNTVCGFSTSTVPLPDGLRTYLEGVLREERELEEEEEEVRDEEEAWEERRDWETEDGEGDWVFLTAPFAGTLGEIRTAGAGVWGRMLMREEEEEEEENERDVCLEGWDLSGCWDWEVKVGWDSDTPENEKEEIGCAAESKSENSKAWFSPLLQTTTQQSTSVKPPKTPRLSAAR